MKVSKNVRILIPIYGLALSALLLSSLFISKTVTVAAENAPLENRKCVIIDAGHGGEDGGATSCTGILESKFNLDVAHKVNDLMHLLGIKTIMIRTKDISIYTEGKSISEKKISDLKERVKITESTPSALLISLHMNHYTDSIYSGPQVFYAPTMQSKDFAGQMQSELKTNLDPDSRRQIKEASGVYLMQKISKTGILIECGFISNPEEESKLRDPEYQKELACVISATTARFLSNT